MLFQYINCEKCRLSLIIGLLVISQTALAQTKIVFRIDLEQQMKDSVFVPPLNKIVVTGNQLPFARFIPLKDEEPIDSIFITEVNFPYSFMGKTLKYNFVIKRKIGNLEETYDRILPLQKTKRRVLDVTHFNTLAR